MSARIDLGHVTVTTSDLDRLRRFYESTVDLRLMAIETSMPAPIARMGVFTTESGPALLAFEVPGADFDVHGGPGERGPIDHFTLRAGDAVELAAIADRLVAAGASDGAIAERGPMYSVFARDPDGRVITVVCPNPTWTPSPTLEVVDAERFAHIHGLDRAEVG